MDEAFLRFAQIIERMLAIRGELVNATAEVRAYIERYEIDMPVELDVGRDDSGTLQIGSTPPQYYADTTFRPAYHRLRLIVTREDDPDGA